MSLPVDPKLLLERAGWVRELARHLTLDASSADDLAQETLVAALQGGPREGVPLSRWLASVARHLAMGERRSKARRRGREVHAAKPEAGPAADDMLDRLEAHRALEQ